MNFLRQINTFLDDADAETTNAAPGEMPAMPSLTKVSIGGAFGSMVGAASKVAGKAAKTAKAVQNELAQAVKLDDDDYEDNPRSEKAELTADVSSSLEDSTASFAVSNSTPTTHLVALTPPPLPAPTPPPLSSDSTPPPPPADASPPRAVSSRASFTPSDFFTPQPPAADSALHSPSPLEYSTPLPPVSSLPPPPAHSALSPVGSTPLPPSPGSLLGSEITAQTPSGGLLSDPVDQMSVNESSWEKVEDTKGHSMVSSNSSDRVLEEYNAVDVKRKTSDGWSQEESIALSVENSNDAEVDAVARVSMLEILTARQQSDLESAAGRASTLDGALKEAREDATSWRQKAVQLERRQTESDDAAEWKTKVEELTRARKQAENDAREEIALWKAKLDQHKNQHQQERLTLDERILVANDEITALSKKLEHVNLEHVEALRAANDETTAWKKKLDHAKLENADALRVANDEMTALAEMQERLQEQLQNQSGEVDAAAAAQIQAAVARAEDAERSLQDLQGRLQEQLQSHNGEVDVAAAAKIEAAVARAEEAEKSLQDLQERMQEQLENHDGEADAAGTAKIEVAVARAEQAEMRVEELQERLQEQLQSQNGEVDAAAAAKIEAAVARAEEAENSLQRLQERSQSQNGEADAVAAAKIEAAVARAEEAEKSLEDERQRVGVMEEQLRQQNDSQPLVLATARAEEAERLLVETRAQLFALEKDLAETHQGSLREIEQLHEIVQEEKRKGAVAQQLEAQLQTVTSERDQAQEQAKQVIGQLARLQKAMGNSESEGAKLRDVLEERQSAAATLQKKVKTLESELKQSQSSSKVDEEVNQVREEMERELNTIMQGKEKQITMLKQSIDARKQQESQLTKESDKMRKELEGARREVLEAKKQEEFLTQKHAREMEALVSDAASAAEKAALSGNQEGRDKAELQRNLRSMEMVLQEEIEKLDSANRDYSRQVLSLQAENGRLQGKQDELMQELARVSAEVSADHSDEKEKVVENSPQVPILEAQVSQLQEKLDEAVQMRQIFQRDAEAYGRELQAVQTERRELEGNIDELHRRIDSNKAVSTASTGYLAKVDEDAQNRISAQREEIEYLRQKNQEKTKRVEQLTCEKNALAFEMRNRETPGGGDLEKQTLMEKDSRVRMMKLSSTVHPVLLSLDEVLRLGVRQLSQTPTLRIVFAVYLIVHHIFSLLLLQFGVG
eukprot:GEMP01002111.1.p1 GENE.GEMP01002111.1~~GEMP01002111.1.p1  ORF type:complete len:1202 (+),score=392.24 GEMP01002111.1:348-3953(+)